MHETKLKVRYAETDRMGVVYYANYYVWFEVARTEHLESLGISYRDIEEDDCLRLVVAESRCSYKSPVTYNDQITIESRISEVNNSSLWFDYIIRCGERLVAEGRTAHVFTNNIGRPVKIPEKIRSVIKPLNI